MNYKKTGVFVLLLATVLLRNITEAQTNPYKPSIIPPSPNAASIAKFGNLPVSTYTGTTEISVPVYEIKAKGVTVPVGLSYHTGGIRLAEESGTVGLGWALNAGGIISRTVKDKDDFNHDYFNSDLVTDFPEVKGKLIYHALHNSYEVPLGDWGYNFTCDMRVHTDSSTYDFYPVKAAWLPNPGVYDLEADEYTYSFPGQSGKFIIGRDGKVILSKQENLKVSYTSGGGSFTIIDEQGNRYYFNEIEYSAPTTNTSASVKSSWLLSKIITQQKDSVMFNYTTDSTWTSVHGIVHESDREGVGGQTGMTYDNDPGQSYLNKTLQNIDYSNAQIQFSFDGNRSDLQYGKKLDAIKIYSKDISGLHYIKEQHLYYSYFDPSPGSDTLEFKRLRLDSVKEMCVTNGTSLPPYSFVYNTSAAIPSLLGKHYSSVDHWGFWNGHANGISGDNTKGFIPPFCGPIAVGCPINNGYYAIYTGANREPDSACMKAFVLNQVNYPTGGFTTIDYDPNYYDYAKSRSANDQTDFEYVPFSSVSKTITTSANDSSGTIDLSGIMGGTAYGNRYIVNVTFYAASTDSMTYYRNNLGYGKLNFTINGNVFDISNNSGYRSGSPSPGNVYSFVDTLPVTAFTYSWSSHIDPRVVRPGGLSFIQVTYTYYQADYTTQTQTMAGGLRVKALTDYAVSGKMAKKRTYDYGYQAIPPGGSTLQPYSYGKIMSYMAYGRYELLAVGSSGYGVSFTRYSSSNTATTSNSSGNIVGYDTVTEYTVDSLNNNIGKTVYTYYNNPDTSYNYQGYRQPGSLNMACALNGTPRSKTVYASAGAGYNKLSRTDYYYRTANRIIYDGMKYFVIPGVNFSTSVDMIDTCTYHSGSGSPGCLCPTLKDSAVYHMAGFFYPAMVSEVPLLDSTVETQVDQLDTTIQMQSTTANFYDNPKHYQLTRSRVLDSKGNTHISYIKYPQDYIPTGYTTTGNTILDTIINKNMISIPVEKSDSLYYAGSGTGYTAGAQVTSFKIVSPGNVILPDKTYKLAINSPITDFQPMAISGNTVTQDSRYALMVTMNSYDSAYNIAQYTTADQIPVSIIWDYSRTYPIAEVKHAAVADVAYTSFEAGNKGGWTYSGAVTADATSPTGNNCYSVTGGAITRSLSSSRYYIVSYWTKNSTSYSSITGNTSGYPKQGKTINGWTYFEHRVTGLASISISGSNYIDELRLYPDTAQMTTFTYSPLVGMTSQCDLNNRITYYQYDALGRLALVSDQDKNIIKKICYNYYGQPAACDYTVVWNTSQSQTFTRNNCTAGYIAGTATYTVPANTYYSNTQTAANNLALADITANGQNYANANATCTVPPSVTINYNNVAGVSLFYAVYTNTATLAVTSFPVPSSGTGTLGTVPQGNYNITISKSGNGTNYFFGVCPTGGIYAQPSASFSNISVSSSGCNTVKITP